MRRLFLSIIFSVLALQTVSASQVTVGFENLQSVCGAQDYNGCNLGTANPYKNQGVVFDNTFALNMTFPDTNRGIVQSIFPYGSYYMQIPTGEGTQGYSAIRFVDPTTGAPRYVTSVEFVVLGIHGDVIDRPNADGTTTAGARGGASTPSPDHPNAVTCNGGVDACPNWLSGFDAYAYQGSALTNGQIMYDAHVDPINQGEAGYNTLQDFANFRVVFSAGGVDTAFSEIRFYPTQAMAGGVAQWGLIAIDQLTFQPVEVPEPGTFVLGGIALAGLALRKRLTRA